VYANQLADPARSGGAGVGGGLHRADIAPDDRGHETRIHFLPADEHHIRGLQHGVGGLDHPDKAAGLDHSERVPDIHFLVGHGRILPSLPLPQGRDVRDVMAAVPPVVLRLVANRHGLAMFGMNERAPELLRAE